MLGIEVADPVYESLKFTVAPNEFLCLYPDGLMEAVNCPGAEFGEEGIESALASAPATTAAEVLDYIMARYDAFTEGREPADDLTVVGPEKSRNSFMEIAFILVEPAYQENVGGSARALKTMGFRDLRLVNPAADLGGRTEWAAHGSADILESAGIYSSLADAAADLDFLVAASARRRTIPKLPEPAEKLPEIFADPASGIRRAGIVFGRESSGLTNEEVLACNMLTTIDLAVSFPSLNLAQAVMIYAYILRGMAARAQKGGAVPGMETRTRVTARVERALTTLGYGQEDSLYHFILDRVAVADSRWVRMIHSILERFEAFNVRREDRTKTQV